MEQTKKGVVLRVNRMVDKRNTNIGDIMRVKDAVMAIVKSRLNNTNGTVSCPVCCRGTVSFTVSHGLIAAMCSEKNCVSTIEKG